MSVITDPHDSLPLYTVYMHKNHQECTVCGPANGHGL